MAEIGGSVALSTDWKAVADELYMFIVGVMAGRAYNEGKNVDEARRRARALYDESIKHNTKKEKK